MSFWFCFDLREIGSCPARSGAEYVSSSWLLPLVVQTKEGAVLESDRLGFDWFLSSSFLQLELRVLLFFLSLYIV